MKRSSTLLPLLLPLALLGCGNTDTDEDGLTLAQEQDLGSDPDMADTDSDGLPDGEEATLGTDPTERDSDRDGLDDAEELELGTNPSEEDSDGDRLDDGREEEDGSDPTNPFSWPGDGIWPNLSLGAPDGEEYAVGEVFPNFRAYDEWENELRLDHFFGEVILVDFSAGWCGPCNEVAETAEELWEEYREDGFVIIHAMVDDWTYGGDSDPRFLHEWSDTHELTFPVLGVNADGEGDIRSVSEDLYAAGINQGYIPFMLLIDQDLVLDTVYTDGGNDALISARVEELLYD